MQCGSHEKHDGDGVGSLPSCAYCERQGLLESDTDVLVATHQHSRGVSNATDSIFVQASRIAVKQAGQYWATALPLCSSCHLSTKF